jgi:hypothetical protein
VPHGSRVLSACGTRAKHEGFDFFRENCDQSNSPFCFLGLASGESSLVARIELNVINRIGSLPVIRVIQTDE